MGQCVSKKKQPLLGQQNQQVRNLINLVDNPTDRKHFTDMTDKHPDQLNKIAKQINIYLATRLSSKLAPVAKTL